MILSIYIERIKKGSIIEERFSISPKNKILIEEERSVFHFINLICLQNSLPLPIQKINIYNFLRIHYYSWDDSVKNIQTTLTLKYNYIPFVGKRKCSKCIHYRKINKKSFCSGRLKEIKNDTWSGCLFWTENSIIRETNDKNINQ